MKKTKEMTIIAIFIAIIIMLATTPLGFIPLGFTKATTIHIPVILGSIILGYKAGMILGGVFGVTSIVINTISPALTSFVFTPFYDGGNFFSLVIALVPRILIGLVAWAVYNFLLKTIKNQSISLVCAGILGSLTNTFLVMGGIFTFFGENYALAKNVAFEKLYSVIGGIILVNGVPEAIVAGFLVLLIGKVLIKTVKI